MLQHAATYCNKQAPWTPSGLRRKTLTLESDEISLAFSSAVLILFLLWVSVPDVFCYVRDMTHPCVT